MDLFKNFGEMAKTTARTVGEKSSDLIEVGKLKMQVSQLENETRRLKTEIGQIFYDAYTNRDELPNEKIISLCDEIEEKDREIEGLNERISRI